MIKDIIELNFPEYATLSHATCQMQDMAEKTITTQVKIDGDITPDFSTDWEIEFQGEKYIMPLRQPQGSKENTSLDSLIDLTFQHWAVYQLKRWMFFTVQPVVTGTAVADKYIASVSLNLKDFCHLFSQVLEYYYGDTITLDLNPAWKSKAEPTNIEINHSYIWDVLIRIYELFAVRWQIEPNGSRDKYVIKIGYPAAELDHIFEYGFKGGLLKVERQMQSEDIRNMLLGRGGEKNLPRYYFKEVPEDEKELYHQDPDWIPELQNVYFSELHGATFRSYIQGWKAKHHGGTTTKAQAYAPWAWELGYTDEKFNPVEYVKDDDSIAKYGPLLGGLDNNEEIYPTIQGIVVEPYGRIDETIDVEQVTTDDVEANEENYVSFFDKDGYSFGSTILNTSPGYANITTARIKFTVKAGRYANLDAKVGIAFVSEYIHGYELKELDASQTARYISHTINIYDSQTGEKRPAVGIPAGEYYYEVIVRVQNTTLNKTINITVHGTIEAQSASINDDRWSDTFNIWVKNIWGTTKLANETAEQYAERVWRPILGDREGGEAKVMFTTGALAVSDDYEFIIPSGMLPQYDTSRQLAIKDADGNPTGEYYTSHWRITLGKSDADLESIGLYVPSTKRQGKAGDHFLFIGTEMTHDYTLWAEKLLDDTKTDALHEVKDIKPTWVVTTDRVRLNNEGKRNALIQQLKAGSSVRLADKRFIPIGEDKAYELLYLQSLTYTYREPSNSDPALNPDVEIVLADKYETVANPVATMQGDINAIQRQLGSISNIEQIVRAVGDKLYLRKDGISDRSLSPTQFFSLLTSGNFRSGIIGGSEWGIYKDANGNWVIEADRFKARQDFEVNTLVINQAEGRGGMEIDTAAFLQVTRVFETEDSYVCYFDQKNGSVANLFHVGDVAYCNRFTSENQDLKFYKRRVTDVSDESVTLTKGYDADNLPDGWIDSGVNGAGIPTQGDIIIHYGSYTESARQYVKVRDVINGGYERYLEGLNSVNATGIEYYFVGKQDGQNTRWFIGHKDGNYAEWRNGQLYIKGNIEMGPGSTGLGDVDEFKNLEEKVNNIQIGNLNLLKNTRGFSEGWSGTGILQQDKYLGLSVYYQTGVDITDRYQDIRYQNTLLLPDTEYTLSFYAKGSGHLVTYVFPNALGQIIMTNGYPEWIGAKPTDGHCEYPLSSEWKRYFVTFRTTDDTTQIHPSGTNKIVLFRVNKGPNEAYICGAKLEKGNVHSDWSPAPEDADNSGLQFIKQIFPNGLINNAATVSQLLAVRNSMDTNANIVAGIYGGGVEELEKKGFKDTEHGKLMFFAGAKEGINDNKVASAAARIYEDGTIITNKLIAEGGQIGTFNDGFIIGTNYIEGSFQSGGYIKISSHYQEGIKLNDNNWERFIQIGTILKSEVTGMSGLTSYVTSLLIQQNTSMSGAVNTVQCGAVIRAKRQIALLLNQGDAETNTYNINRDNHALYILHGNVAGFRPFTRRLNISTTLTPHDSVLLITASITLTLPADPEDGQMYIFKNITSAANTTLKVGATGHYINDGKYSKKTSWNWNSGEFVMLIWDATNKIWQAGYTRIN